MICQVSFARLRGIGTTHPRRVAESVTEEITKGKRDVNSNKGCISDALRKQVDAHFCVSHYASLSFL